VPGADRALASAADHGGMVNIPEVLLRPAGNRRGSHAAAAMARDGVTRDAARDTIAAHGAPPPALAESAPLAPEGPTAPALAAQEPSPVAAVVPPVPVVPGIRTNDHWIASFRGGIAAVDDGAGTMVRELDMKVGMQMDGGHKVSFIVGIAPAINEMRRQNTGIAMSSPTFSQIPDVTDGAGNSRNQEDEVVAYERIVRSEPWFGVGYNYSMAIVKNVSIDPGMKAGASASTWRIGAELPVSFRMSRNMSLECALSVAHVLPRNVGGDGGSLAVTNTPDHFIYEESKHQSSFTTYGVQLGIRLELLASN
jgi:hypothetical protein